jgi:2-polyprenyl-6-methoxyphenol hydroxylase-like FAD-dependent oxidoreductase
VGLGVNFPCNAVRALRALGVADRLREVATVRRREYRSTHDRMLFAIDENDFWDEHDTPMCAPR